VQDRRALVVVAKYPAEGQVKTRLARTFGARAAATLYAAFLADIGAEMQSGRFAFHWAFTPATSPFPHLPCARDLPADACFAQEGSTLNERLLRVFDRMVARGFTRVAVLSSDSPHVTRATVEAALDRLDGHDVCLGPAEDGGYYLVAMRTAHDIFSGVAMSTPSVLAETLAAARRQALSVSLLPSTFDVDEEADAQRLLASLHQDQGLAARLAHTHGFFLATGPLAAGGAPAVPSTRADGERATHLTDPPWPRPTT
jgi:rSAM/selenodomain-associated transferase 1